MSIIKYQIILHHNSWRKTATFSVYPPASPFAKECPFSVIYWASITPEFSKITPKFHPNRWRNIPPPTISWYKWKWNGRRNRRRADNSPFVLGWRDIHTLSTVMFVYALHLHIDGFTSAQSPSSQLSVVPVYPFPFRKGYVLLLLELY